jgi:hypothetical protein
MTEDKKQILRFSTCSGKKVGKVLVGKKKTSILDETRVVARELHRIRRGSASLLGASGSRSTLPRHCRPCLADCLDPYILGTRKLPETKQSTLTPNRWS